MEIDRCDVERPGEKKPVACNRKGPRIKGAELRIACGLDKTVVDARARDEYILQTEQRILIRCLQRTAVAVGVVGGTVEFADGIGRFKVVRNTVGELGRRDALDAVIR